LHTIFIEATTTDIDMILQVKLQIWNNIWFVATSDVYCFAHY